LDPRRSHAGILLTDKPPTVRTAIIETRTDSAGLCRRDRDASERLDPGASREAVLGASRCGSLLPLLGKLQKCGIPCARALSCFLTV